MSIAGRMLTDARKRARLTQRQLAEKSGVPQASIARIERARVKSIVATDYGWVDAEDRHFRPSTSRSADSTVG